MSFIQNLFGQPDIEKLITRRDTNGLAKALNYNKDANIRLAVVKALSKIGDTQAIEYLIGALNNDDVVDCPDRSAPDIAAGLADLHVPLIFAVRRCPRRCAGC